jgi:hypothetical protein
VGVGVECGERRKGDESMDGGNVCCFRHSYEKDDLRAMTRGSDLGACAQCLRKGSRVKVRVSSQTLRMCFEWCEENG